MPAWNGRSAIPRIARLPGSGFPGSASTIPNAMRSASVSRSIPGTASLITARSAISTAPGARFITRWRGFDRSILASGNDEPLTTKWRRLEHRHDLAHHLVPVREAAFVVAPERVFHGVHQAVVAVSAGLGGTSDALLEHLHHVVVCDQRPRNGHRVAHSIVDGPVDQFGCLESSGAQHGHV